MGDFDKSNNHMKDKEPVICRSLEKYSKMQVIRPI